MCSVDVIIFYVPRPTFVFGFFIEIEIEINGHEIASKISTTKRAGDLWRRFKFFERARKALRIDLGVSERHPKFAVLISAANELSLPPPVA